MVAGRTNHLDLSQDLSGVVRPSAVPVPTCTVCAFIKHRVIVAPVLRTDLLILGVRSLDFDVLARGDQVRLRHIACAVRKAAPVCRKAYDVGFRVVQIRMHREALDFLHVQPPLPDYKYTRPLGDTGISARCIPRAPSSIWQVNRNTSGTDTKLCNISSDIETHSASCPPDVRHSSSDVGAARLHSASIVSI